MKQCFHVNFEKDFPKGFLKNIPRYFTWKRRGNNRFHVVSTWNNMYSGTLQCDCFDKILKVIDPFQFIVVFYINDTPANNYLFKVA